MGGDGRRFRLSILDHCISRTRAIRLAHLELDVDWHGISCQVRGNFRVGEEIITYSTDVLLRQAKLLAEVITSNLVYQALVKGLSHSRQVCCLRNLSSAI